MSGSTNPFEELHPVMRNEEDEIRKGIFSYALRKLQGLSFAEKLAWCEAIKEATAPKQGKAKATAPAPVAQETPVAVAVVEDDERLPSAADNTTTGEKRPRDEATADTLSPAPQVARVETASPAAPTPAPSVSVASSSDAPATTEAASEFISAYMRTLLDKVVGGSLNDLAVPALRVLCLMADITTTARSKDALYSMLANFHFTKCAKLGKRVSKQTIVQQEALQTAEMMRQLPSTGPRGAAKKAVPLEEGTSERRRKTKSEIAAEAPKAKSKASEGTEGRKAAKTSTKRASTSTKTGVSSSEKRAHAVHAIYGRGTDSDNEDDYYDDDDISSSEDGADGLSISFRPRAFLQPPGNTGALSSSRATMPSGRPANDASGSSSTSEWSTQDLDRKIASIVQLYDPVTVAIVVKKLNQMGYREASAASVVESTLTRFHKMHLIFYDNGIAYML